MLLKKRFESASEALASEIIEGKVWWQMDFNGLKRCDCPCILLCRSGIL